MGVVYSAVTSRAVHQENELRSCSSQNTKGWASSFFFKVIICYCIHYHDGIRNWLHSLVSGFGSQRLLSIIPQMITLIGFMVMAQLTLTCAFDRVHITSGVMNLSHHSAKLCLCWFYFFWSNRAIFSV